MKIWVAVLSLVATCSCLNSVAAGDSQDEELDQKPRPKYWNITGRVDGKNFEGQCFGGTTLAGADFSHSRLLRADLSGCDVRHVNFSGADLRGALLIGTRMRLTDFRGADLRGADLRATRIEQPLFEGATFDTTTRWPLNFSPLRWGARLVAAPRP